MNALLKYIYFLILLFVNEQAICQEAQMTFSIQSVIIDSLNKQPIPFASIYKIRDHQGTLSDYHGVFTLENVLAGDTLFCKNIGYEQKYFIANPFVKHDTLYMNRTTQLLDEVTIIANDAFLYTLISNATKINSTKKITAKTYFELESFHDQTQLELFQGYYNGSFQGYDVSSLEMKNARFALAPIVNRIFASTETSKALYMHELLKSNAYFPIGPFELNSKKLRKDYALSLVSKYKDEDQKTIYVINFLPRKDPDQYFEGTVWIDSISATILKVTLKIANTKTHPFQSIWSTDTLENVSIELTKKFTQKDDETFVNSIDFKYTLSYKSSVDSTFDLSTRAVLYAYNYNQVFDLPFFHFSESSNSDYRRIQMLTPNTRFWECMNEFKMENNTVDRAQFIHDIATITATNLFSGDTIFNRNFFENPYITWSGKRVLFREESIDTSRYSLEQGTIPSQRYHLEVQLFMDINEVCDSVQIITKTIFDPYLSFYKFNTTKESQAFINIYFDLMEIERRKLAAELIKCKNDIPLMKMKYNEAVKTAEIMSKNYFKEIERGTNKSNLKKWNTIIIEELNIDNLALFQIEL